MREWRAIPARERRTAGKGRCSLGFSHLGPRDFPAQWRLPKPGYCPHAANRILPLLAKSGKTKTKNGRDGTNRFHAKSYLKNGLGGGERPREPRIPGVFGSRGRSPHLVKIYE